MNLFVLFILIVIIVISIIFTLDSKNKRDEIIKKIKERQISFHFLCPWCYEKKERSKTICSKCSEEVKRVKEQREKKMEQWLKDQSKNI